MMLLSLWILIFFNYFFLNTNKQKKKIVRYDCIFYTSNVMSFRYILVY